MSSMADRHQSLTKRDILSQDNDPNIGSARGTSTDAFTTTLAVNTLIFVVITTLFVAFRRRNRRIYAPLTCVVSIVSWRKLKCFDKTRYGIVDTVEGISGFSKPFAWMRSVVGLPDETVIRTNGIDGYLFLRYIRQSMMLCFIGVVLTFPLILPFNATGGAGQSGLDILSFSNLGESSNKRLYAHVLVSYVYFGIVLFVIYRELLYYVAIRQAYMHSDLYASRLSARTLLISMIPEKYGSKEALKAVFGSSVEHIWINKHNPKLENLVDRRNKVAMKLEEAEVEFIRRSDKLRRKAIRKGIVPDTEQGLPVDNGSTSAQRGSNTPKQPTHRVKWGKRVDTIDWCRLELEKLNLQVDEQQKKQRSGETGKIMNSAFVSFSSQSAAQIAFRHVIHDLTMQMAPRYIGVSSGEVVWQNLNTGWWERQVRVLATTAFFAAITLFWSIPNALVGTISQLDYLAEKVPFLGFILELPDFIVGAITGLLPPLLLTLLLDLVPKILMWLIRLSGEPSRPNIELRLQNWYFIFLVIQVFLVTTITSAASAAATQIIKDPTSITGLLAENLPKASNFYISYMLLQGLSVSSTIVFQFINLVLYKVLAFFFDNTPRKSWARWAGLEDPGIGTMFPFYTNFCVIALTYSVIAPLVLVFATFGLGLVYLAYRYNLLFVYNIQVSTKGLVYPRAWFQTLTGVYLAEICLIGLFALKKEIGPVVLQLILVACTIAFQKSLTSNIAPLLEFLPDLPPPPAHTPHTPPTTTTTPETPITEKSAIKFAFRSLSSFSTLSTLSTLSTTSTPTAKWSLLRPEKYLDHRVLEKLIPHIDRPVPASPEAYDHVYHHPYVTAPPPVIWVPRDVGGVAEREMRETRRVNAISDEGVVVDAKSGRIVIGGVGVLGAEEVAVVPPDFESEELWAA